MFPLSPAKAEFYRIGKAKGLILLWHKGTAPSTKIHNQKSVVNFGIMV